MSDNFQAGDEVRGKDSDLRGLVLKVLDEGWLMIEETNHGMEMNVHRSEVVKTEVSFMQFNHSRPPANKEVKTVKTPSLVTIDLHWEKLPPSYKNGPLPPLQAQLDYLEVSLNQASRSGCKIVKVIHGKGNGKLRTASLSLIRNHRLVKGIKELKTALEPPHGVEVHF